MIIHYIMVLTFAYVSMLLVEQDTSQMSLLNLPMCTQN